MKKEQVGASYKMGKGEFKSNLRLFENIQFIYELALAKLELEAMGVDFKIEENLRHFRCIIPDNEDELRRRLAYFDKINGETTDYSHIVKKNRTRSPNQYLTHWIYPYKGKYHPQMIRALLNVMGVKKGDTILDPFIGSGTTSLECQLLGINSIGIDVSQVCVLVSKVKVESSEILDDIEEIRDEMTGGFEGPEGLREKVNEIENERVRNFYKVAELIAHSDRSRRRRKDFGLSFSNNVEKMLSSVTDFKNIVDDLMLPLGQAVNEIGDSRNLKLDDESIDGIITSPPYSIALDYVKNDEHAFKALGYEIEDIRDEFIGVRGKGKEKVDLYNMDMEKSYEEMHRVLKPGKYCVIVIGNATIQGREVPTVANTINYCKKIGFKLEKSMDKIIYGLYNVIQKENILLFKKE